MVKIAVIGCQFGDEGKGRAVDWLLKERKYGLFEVVCRYQGGANAGHRRVIGGQTLDTHILPSGAGVNGVYNLIWSGVVISPDQILEEMGYFSKRGFPITPDNLGIDRKAHVILPYHIEEDGEADETEGGKKRIGTTKRGIGPAYSDKSRRVGIRFCEFLNPNSFTKALEYNRTVTGRDFDISGYATRYAEAQRLLSSFAVDERAILSELKEKNWLFEGAQGALLDMDEGTYPFVTSSNPTKLPVDVDGRIGIIKAFMTRVGEGPFPTAVDNETAVILRGEREDVDGDYGITTRRPRGIGWQDLVLTRHGVESSGAEDLILTKLDTLGRVPKILVCTEYEIRGKRFSKPPADRYQYKDVKPVYREMKGWQGKDISGVREEKDLPQEAIDYIKFLEDGLERRIVAVFVGPEAEQTIVR